ncbi:hypothetical protein FF38_10516 [Lucilia cuprina]|uniref:3-hydroxyanthranilate 3,4-dioxygenase n=1 Tax=Lucilia cuprina TaxID=7375 RepID=A0A0L0CFM7_LUCCU|nr:hypothetical protein FF38_10516 [Lucilia cuprina]
MCLRIVTPENKFETVVIREGNIYLLPANTPHSPVRFEDTVGIVVEQDRPEGQNDKMRWYCDDCKEIVFEAEFYMYDLGTQVKEGIDIFNKEERVCKCGKKLSIISGALYHLVATYSVIALTACEYSSKPLAKPKSQILTSQSALTNKLPGFKSRCNTPAL